MSNTGLNALVTYWANISYRFSRDGGSPKKLLTYAMANSIAAHSGENQTGSWSEADKRVERLLESVGGINKEAQVAFNLMLLQNVASLEARYPDNEDMFDTTGYTFKESQRARMLTRRETGPLVGLVNCYSYQSCEDRDWEKSPGFFLAEQIKRNLLQDYYSQANDCWDTWEENPSQAQAA